MKKENILEKNDLKPILNFINNIDSSIVKITGKSYLIKNKLIDIDQQTKFRIGRIAEKNIQK